MNFGGGGGGPAPRAALSMHGTNHSATAVCAAAIRAEEREASMASDPFCYHDS